MSLALITGIFFGITIASLAITIFHAATYLERIRLPGTLLREADANWQALSVISLWFASAIFFGWYLMSEVVWGAGGSIGPFDRSAGRVAASFVGLVSVEVIFVLYLPGLSFARNFQLARSGNRKNASTVSMRAAGNALRLIVNKLRTPSPGRGAAWMAHLSMRAAWVTFVAILLQLVLGSLLALSSTFFAVELATIFILLCCAAAVVGCFLTILDTPSDKLGFYSKETAGAVFHPKDLPSEVQHEYKSNLKNRERTKRQLLRNHRMKQSRAIFLCSCVLFYCLFLALAVAIDEKSQRSILFVAICLLSLNALTMLFQFHRRVVELWTDTGFRAANIFSQGFVKDSGHQLRNIASPLRTVVKRASQVIEGLNPEKTHDPELTRITQDLMPRGASAISRLEEWLGDLSETSQDISRKRRRWLESRHVVARPVPDAVVEIFECVHQQLVSFDDQFGDDPVTFRYRISTQDDLVLTNGSGQVASTSDLPSIPTVAEIHQAFMKYNLPAAQQDLVVDYAMLYDTLSNITRNSAEALLGLLADRSASGKDVQSGVVRDDWRPTITTAVRLFPLDPFPIYISVRDNGPGIKPEDRTAVFDAYRRSVGKLHSTGVGLYAAGEFASSFGARLEFATSRGEKEKGLPSFTTFVLQIPQSSIRSTLDPVV